MTKVIEATMSLTATQSKKLKQLIRLAQELLASAEIDTRPLNGARQAKKKDAHATRHRRSGKELVAFRKMLKAERKKGVPVAELAKKHGISSAYIYQLGA